MIHEPKRIGLVGNPNVGKTSLFNALTGLNQKTGNFAGVTVESFVGRLIISDKVFLLVDLPGTYSLYPKTDDEKEVLKALYNESDETSIDYVIMVLDASALKRSLLLFSQVADLSLPMVVALTMEDVAEKRNERINKVYLEQLFKVPVVSVNVNNGEGIDVLKTLIYQNGFKKSVNFFNPETVVHPDFLNEVKRELNVSNSYKALLKTHQSFEWTENSKIKHLIHRWNFVSKNVQAREILKRYQIINQIESNAVIKNWHSKKISITEKLDKILTHKIYGYFVFLLILFLVFQSIYVFAKYPMAWIEQFILKIQKFVYPFLGSGMLADLITKGILSGIGGVLMFVPQIAFLFFFIIVLEESGYMARVMFIMDRVMRIFGMSGKSIIPLVSGAACAVPAILSTRSIENRKERLITLFVTPFIACSARIPVFTMMIGLLVEPQNIFIFNVQGLLLMGCYLVGFFAALITAFVMKKFKITGDNSIFIFELPEYRIPTLKNIYITLYHKILNFIKDAGTIIVAISVILWWLASFGPEKKMEKAAQEAKEVALKNDIPYEQVLEAKKLEYSYAGHVGKFIEPILNPMGFDWKIGIALLTSFAAREVFVGTMATIYSVNLDLNNPKTLTERLRIEKKAHSNEPVFSLAVCSSLLIFYILALQCMSTVAVTYKETKSLKWTFAQFFYMTGLAYCASILVYQLLK